MIKNIILKVKFVIILSYVFIGCKTISFTHTDDNFHQNQANEIIDKTTRNKSRRERHKERRRQAHEDHLNKLNDNDNTKNKKVHQKPKFRFY